MVRASNVNSGLPGRARVAVVVDGRALSAGGRNSAAVAQTKVCATGYQSLTSTWWHRLQPVEAFFRSLLVLWQKAVFGPLALQ